MQSLLSQSKSFYMHKYEKNDKFPKLILICYYGIKHVRNVLGDFLEKIANLELSYKKIQDSGVFVGWSTRGYTKNHNSETKYDQKKRILTREK